MHPSELRRDGQIPASTFVIGSSPRGGKPDGRPTADRQTRTARRHWLNGRGRWRDILELQPFCPVTLSRRPGTGSNVTCGSSRDRSSGPPSSRRLWLRPQLVRIALENHNLVIEVRSAEGKHERYAALSTELAALKVDVIVTSGGTSARLGRQASTGTLPIVFS